MEQHKSFGVFVKRLRKNRKISLQVFGNGLCDVSHLSRIENGKVGATKLLRDRLLGRLGVAAENHEKFLYYSEYKCWKERRDIVYSILYGKIEKARVLLENYQTKHSYAMRQPLEYQFYLTMLAQIRQCEGANKEELRELIQKAVTLTIPEPTTRQLKSRVLCIEELNLLLEYGFYNEEEVSLEWYKEFISYVEQLPLDELSLAKIYPKAVYYLYRIWRNESNIGKIDTGKILKFCNKAIEILQKSKRMFYLWEILEIEKQLLQELITKNEIKSVVAKKQLQERYQKCSDWHKVLKEVYEEYGISKEMKEYCYIYLDKEIFCIGNVIKVRRNMLGMTMRELSEGICTERTISRLENNAIELSWETVSLLFERLNIKMGFYGDDLFVESLENTQLIRCNELVKVCDEQALDSASYIKMLKEVLEYTIPYTRVITSGEKYLTKSEWVCLKNIVKWMDWSYPEMEQCIQVLYDLFEHQRQIEDCFDMYEFIMGTVASKFGDKGEYDLSNKIKVKILKNSLIHRRFGNIHEEIL